jgi:hypothetical protein
MMHMLFWNQKGGVQMQTFATRQSFVDFYGGYAPGQLVEKTEDLTALSARYAGNTEVAALLATIDPEVLG